MAIRPKHLQTPPFEEIPEDRKYCTHCGELKHKTEFHVDSTRADGYRDHCKQCRELIRQEQQALAAPLVNMEEQALDMLDSLSSSGGSHVPHTTEAVEALMRPFGGMDGFGKWMFATFLAARPGSTVRERLLSRILDLVEMNSAKGDADAPLDKMEDRDLIRIMSVHLLEFQKKSELPSTAVPTVDGKVVDAVRVLRRDE